MTAVRRRIIVRNTQPEDFETVIAICQRVYPHAPPWRPDQLASHHRLFPEGQCVAVRLNPEETVGYSASLIVRWDDYEDTDTWHDFTDRGMFTNHDPENGRTLYGAEVMVDPSAQRTGVGAHLYRARRRLAMRLGLLRIRAAARLRGYHRHARKMSAQEYVIKVVRKELRDPTLSFQLREGFDVVRVVSGYLEHDPESLGCAAVIEWLNPLLARPEDSAKRDPRYARLPEPPPVPPETPPGAPAAG